MNLAKIDDQCSGNLGTTKSKLQKAINELAPKQNMVVILRAFQDLPYKQIGKIMGISENSAKVNYYHALKNLKKSLKKMGIKNEKM